MPVSRNEAGDEEEEDDDALRVLFVAYQTLHRINDLGSFQPRAYTQIKSRFPGRSKTRRLRERADRES